jgi:hypothetical protein
MVTMTMTKSQLKGLISLCGTITCLVMVALRHVLWNAIEFLSPVIDRHRLIPSFLESPPSVAFHTSSACWTIPLTMTLLSSGLLLIRALLTVQVHALAQVELGKVLDASISSMFFLQVLRLTCTSDCVHQAHTGLDLAVSFFRHE